MAKPILVVRIPNQKVDNIHQVRRSVSSGCNHEYHVFLIVKEDDSKEISFEAYNAENMPEVDIKKLAEIVNEHNASYENI